MGYKAVPISGVTRHWRIGSTERIDQLGKTNAPKVLFAVFHGVPVDVASRHNEAARCGFIVFRFDTKS